MAHRQFTLTNQESTELRQAANRTREPEELKRLQAVRLYGEGQPMSDVVRLVDVAERSVLRWCAQYREEGLAGLASGRVGNQNAARLSREQRADLKDKLRQYKPDQVLPPRIRISAGAFWTVSDLRIAVQQWYGVRYQSDTSYRTLFKQCGYSLQRTERRYRSRPSDEEIADFEAELEKK
jgi:transposase